MPFNFGCLRGLHHHQHHGRQDGFVVNAAFAVERAFADDAGVGVDAPVLGFGGADGHGVDVGVQHDTRLALAQRRDGVARV